MTYEERIQFPPLYYFSPQRYWRRLAGTASSTRGICFVRVLSVPLYLLLSGLAFRNWFVAKKYYHMSYTRVPWKGAASIGLSKTVIT